MFVAQDPHRAAIRPSRLVSCSLAARDAGEHSSLFKPLYGHRSLRRDTGGCSSDLPPSSIATWHHDADAGQGNAAASSLSTQIPIASCPAPLKLSRSRQTGDVAGPVWGGGLRCGAYWHLCNRVAVLHNEVVGKCPTGPICPRLNIVGRMTPEGHVRSWSP